MRTNVTELLWITLFVHFCVAPPWIAASNDSCPCRPINECPNGSEDLLEKGQVSMLPCESDLLTRCCSTVPKAIESANVRGSSRQNEVVDLETDSIEESTSLEKESTSSDASEEYSTATLQPNVEESTNGSVSSSTAAEDVATTASDVNSTHKPLQHVHSKPRPLRVRILNRIATPPPFPREQASLKRGQHGLENNNKLTKQEVASFTQEDQALIEQITNFESHRTSPKKPASFPSKTARESQEQKSSRNINSLIPGKVFLNRNYHSNANSKFSSISERVAAKTSDAFEQKTSLGTPLTLDGASIRAINENASSPSELDGDTSIRSLSEPEDAENIKRVARSHASELDEKPRDENFSSTGNANVSTKQDEKKEVPLAKGFKPPPRLLPIRNLRNGEQTSGKFANTRERVRSLFDKSNMTRRKQVSVIIHRRDPKMKEFHSVNKNSTSMETVDNKYSDSDKSENSSVVEAVTRLVDKSVTDSMEVL